MSVFLLDHLDTKILDSAMFQANRAGISVDLKGAVRCETGFNTGRRQWDADLVLSDCTKRMARKEESLSLFITERDLYAAPLNFVFGLARRDLHAAIVSWNRLKSDDKTILATRLAKEIVHEVGHLEGLEHCKKPNCVMWFSNTLYETDRKGVNFCDACRQRIS